MRSESSCRLGRPDQLTDFLPVHANSSGSASETCRCVLLPSAQTSLNDLSTTYYRLSASPRQLFKQRFRNMQVHSFALSSGPLSASPRQLFRQRFRNMQVYSFLCPQLRPPLRQPTSTLQAVLQKHAGVFLCP